MRELSSYKVEIATDRAAIFRDLEADTYKGSIVLTFPDGTAFDLLG